MVIEKDTSVLHFPEKLEPLLGLNRHSHAQAVQQVRIVCGRIANACRALETITIFAANVKPVGKDSSSFSIGNSQDGEYESTADGLAAELNWGSFVLAPGLEPCLR